ncbi:hypothetical protein SAMN06297387_107187 [Streptomyces zhaozhouensis]|uniref:DUF4375 domain-containing protein n=1 Tax=Streptomyces zhaozhouensis TaxID=1300267 RepID=A0A286DW11_9ACTN|nr:hypothetical protein [Streptomyces zhaozhouensis]SOD62813.1 hypothetical protein SAMN06297387_107187 [Streptomyces zhaozhouensis]
MTQPDLPRDTAKKDPTHAIWNRVTMPGYETTDRGERELAAVLAVHHLVCNGGVGHAVTVLRQAQLSAAAEGAAYFGLTRLAASFDGMAQAQAFEDVYDFGRSGPLLNRLEEDYDAHTEGGRIHWALRRKLRASPEDFSSA